MDCPSCTAANADGARFCSSCGHSLTGPAEERRVVTVLFADLVGFTTLSEHRDPEAVKRVVDAAFERLVRDVTSFGGRVDKIVGDAIIALFGAPVAHEDDAERAVRAAMRMQETLTGYGEEAGIDIRMRVGVNTGEVLVGSLRAGGDYTAMGDVVNLASRLQTAASPGEVVVGDATHAATEDAIAYDERGQLTARGRDQSERVWVATGVLRPPGRSRGVAGAPLIGRETELSVLVNAARGSVRHSRAQVILLIGEAGVGKTRLAQELATTLAAEDGIATFEGRCLPYGEVNPWWPIAEVLREILGLEGDAPLDEALDVTRRSVGAVMADVGGTGGVVDGVVDGLLHILGYEGPLRGIDGTAARAESARALIEYLECRLRLGPLLVRIADLHWADDTVFELIDELSSRLARQPLVLVATARRELQQRWTPRPGRNNALLLNVDPLDRAAVTQLLGVLTDGSIDAESSELLLDRSGGNPFYLEELVTLVHGPEGGPVPAQPGRLPETLRGLVAARIDALSPAEQEVLGDAAVWGTSGAVQVLDRIAEAARGMGPVADEVQSLADKDVLVLDGTTWGFRSDLVREVTYARLTKSDRLHAHAGIAVYLDRRVQGNEVEESLVESLARHFSEAADLAADLDRDAWRVDLTRRALHWLSEAARRAERTGAWPFAARLYTRMLAMLDREALLPAPTQMASDVVRDGEEEWPGEAEVRMRALLGRSRSLAEQWDHDGALADARAALELSEEMSSPGQRALALQRLAAAHMRHGDWAHTDEALAEALEIHDALGDTAGRGEALRQQGLSQLLRGDHRAAAAPVRGALDCFRQVQDRRGEGWALQSLAWISFGDGRLDLATQYLDASRAALEEAGDRGGLGWTDGLASFVCVARGEFERAGDLAQRVLSGSERRSDRFGAGMMHIVLGSIELWTGHPRAAAASADRALGCLDERTDVVGMEQALTLQGRALAMLGDPSAGFAALERSLAVGRGTSTEYGELVAALTEVQLGLPGAVLDDDRVGPVATATDALRLLQLGRVDAAADALRLTEVAGPGDAVAAATVQAALGDVEPALAAAVAVPTMAGATYNDSALAAVLRALLDRSSAGGELLSSTRAALRTTEDRVMPVLVDLADAVRARRGAQGSSTTMEEAERRLAAVGLGATRWREVFTDIADRAPAELTVENSSG